MTRFSDNAVPWTLTALLLIALAVVLTNMGGFRESAELDDQYKLTLIEEKIHKLSRAVFQEELDAAKRENERLIQEITELEEQLVKCDCH